MDAHIVIDQVSKVFDADGRSVVALQDISLSIPRGQFVCLLGPSGCGKSTLLNAVAGFAAPTRGSVIADGVPVTGPGPERGMVFQEYALFPWMTVEQNVGFGLEIKGQPRAQVGARVAELLKLLSLEDFARAIRRTCRAACASAWRSRACWRWIRRSC
jgi:NitT/TauT family transport system ATP-binding protein